MHIQNRKNTPGDARKIALTVLNTLDSGRKTLDAVLENTHHKHPLMLKRDRSLLYAIVYGVLRWRKRIDWIIDHFSKTPLDKVDPRVLNTLRIGLFQFIYLNRIPVSAAVDTSVEMAKSFAEPWVVRYVNALLRNAAKGYKNIPYPSVENDPEAALSIAKSFPKWLIKKWIGHFGLTATEALCDAINSIPPITIRTNTLKTTRKKLAHALESNAQRVEPTTYSSEGISFYNPEVPVSEIKSFKDGWFQVQDEAAQLISHFLNPQPGETILDACAGLGGKTGHIAQIMKNHGRIVAMDKNAEKLMRLESEMRRLGIKTVTTAPYNLNNTMNGKPLGMFDRILLDAPCSGLGVLRRNPDTKWSMSKNKLRYQSERQIKFLDILSPLVKPSGILVYAVCSTEPEENDAVVNVFLNKHPLFVIINNPMEISNKVRSLVNAKGYLRTLPHVHNMDGFFSVCFKRIK